MGVWGVYMSLYARRWVYMRACEYILVFTGVCECRLVCISGSV